jgi:hypothetical protein
LCLDIILSSLCHMAAFRMTLEHFAFVDQLLANKKAFT